MLQMLLQNNLGRIIQRLAHRSYLNQHLRAIPVVIYHSLDRTHMAFNACQAVDNFLLIRMVVSVCMSFLQSLLLFIILLI